MINNLYEYFAPEQQYFLYKANYEMLENSDHIEECTLNCIDNIRVDLKEDAGIRIIFTRTLEFESGELFELNVSFGAFLKFNEAKKNEKKWKEINLAEEFKDNGEFVLGNLVSRTSLLIAQITSSFGQSPLITPPSITKNS